MISLPKTFFSGCTAALMCLSGGSLALGQEKPSDKAELSQRRLLPAQTDLDRYVQKPDEAYEWSIVSKTETNLTTTVVVDMISQSWLTPAEVNRPKWQHWVTIVIPKEVRSDVGFLMIAGGGNDGQAPTSASPESVRMAEATGTVVTELRMIPNQPLIFHDDGVPRKEDDLIGYTWDQFLQTGDSRWPARNAMVKSVVRAMDTVTAVAKQNGGHDVTRFVVAGGSKRGWTTWLTGAVDDRVVAIIPIVIDVLNSKESLRHHFAAYGYWAPSIGNYAQHNILQRMNDPRMDELMQLIDPYHYRHRLTMPKLVLNAAGDQFFLPDSSQFYYSELEGEKHLRYVPNTDHSMKGSDALETVLAFYSLIVSGQERPQFTWQVNPDGVINVSPKEQPTEVRLWQANNPDARDFRLETLGPKYTSTLLSAEPDGSYAARVESPSVGWTAYFVELTYDLGLPVPLKLTTEVAVTPNKLPFSDRDASQPLTITIKCDTESEETAAKLMTAAQRLIESKLQLKDFVVRQVGTKFYINWSPTDFQVEAGSILKWLESQPCKQINIQLESGPNLTATP